MGRYPKELDALAPKYLAKLAADLFSGKPLIYRPGEKGYLLYSVGANGTFDFVDTTAVKYSRSFYRARLVP